MANTVIALKKSATPSASPNDLANGEIAINYADGVLYYKNAAGYIAQITSGGGGNFFGTVNANGTLVVADTTGDVFSLIPGDNISITADAINDTITIAASGTINSTDQTARDAAAAAYDKANSANITASSAYDKANAANSLAYNTGLGANAFTSATVAGANTAVGTGANAYAAAIANTIAIAAFEYANTISSDADEKANAAIITANAAYDKANSANILAYNALANTDGAAFQGNLYVTGSANVVNVLTANNVAFGVNSSKDKIRLYDTEIPYAIGMANYMTFGPLRNDWAMTFQMNDDIDRGFWWGDVAHTNAQGAMALTTDGNLYVASKIRLGYGETDTTDQENWKYNIDVAGNINAASFLVNTTEVTSISNSFASATIAGANTAVGTGANAFASATIAGANTAVGTGANTFLLRVLDGANTAVGTGANAFTSATIAGANTAVGTGANAFASATIAGANSAVGTGANAYASTILTANVAAANGWTNTVFGFANNKFLANANPGVANNYTYTGNLYITTGSAGVSGNVLIARTVDSTVGNAVKLDVFGGINASALLVNGVAIKSGATGGGTDDIFYENSQNVNSNYTITTNKNAMSAGPITIKAGVTVTVPSGSRWVVV